ncbi:DUF2911 domain-containing protein [Litoribacter alkaliphilus]|uniref:DUF2911 domain-containing protein n=1 Tax=Litoribacter ruber TaxID=702568 RepID=A0AAP2CJG1_9BACT|nr:DUF2911 domain-containing protein [Litoribacter alkaliphilus]MBS9524859.1 DUF2911 domain-containing protein [Litoribacter alkaliphilus]
MKKSNILFIALMLLGSSLVVSCGERSNETERDGEEEIVEDRREERASPLRTAEGTVNNREIRVQYGAPSVKNRTIWGDIAPYDEVWRTGANEATHVEFKEEVQVEGKSLPAGKYSIFTIPKQQGPWTVIFNSEWDLEHGHFQYKEENDVLRVQVSPQWEDDSQEQLVIKVEEPGIVIRWEKLRLPIKVS